MNLAGIINILNVKINEALTCKVDGGVVHGIAEQTLRKTDNGTQVFPTVYDNDGNGKDVTVDDNFPFIVYHRLLNKSYQYPQIKSFGNPKEYIQETTEIVTLVYAKRQYLKINAEQVESIIKLSIPATLNVIQLNDLQLKSCNIQHNSSILDTQTNFNNEYRGFDNFISNEEIFISLRFTIESVFKKDCLNKFCEVTPKEPSVYLFANTYCVDGSGTIEIGWISYNVDFVTISGLGKRKPIGYEEIEITGNTTITITSGTASDSIQIFDSCNNVCPDATAELFDTNGNLLSTTPIASGSTEPIIAPDATILINGDNSFPTIPSGGLENIVVENTAGTPVGAYDGNTNSWVLPDTTYQINVNGNPVTPFDLPTLENNTININWTY